MNELDEFWAELVRERLEDAQAAGHDGARQYLALRASNDAVRSAGVKWLADSVIDAAFAANEPRLKVERIEPHGFAVNGGRATGICVTLAVGVRKFTAEAGWPRTPAEGFVRGGGLALAKLTHFGIPNAGAVLRLICVDGVPSWTEVDSGSVLTTDGLRHHVSVLCGR